MRVILLCCLLVVGALCQSPQQKAIQLVAQMSLDEKMEYVHGSSGSYVGNVPVNQARLIPALNLEDGPQGIADNIQGVTCWPSSLAIAATWDPTMIFAWAQAMGADQRAKGTNIMLGPDINIARCPLGGRIFEMFGEEPFLTASLAPYSVAGIQSNGILACAKHFINNDQEVDRTTISSNVDQRTNWEIYYQPFQAAVNAGVGSIMCSYNKINHTYACENEQTLSDLKEIMGYENFVMSDWGATHSTYAAALNGLDQQMPDASFFGGELAAAVANGSIPESVLDDKLVRILSPLFALNIIGNTTATGNLEVNVVSEEHDALARTLAEEATCLLQNDGILPINIFTTKSIAIIGDAGSATPYTHGEGSGGVIPPYVITPLAGIQEWVGSDVALTYTNSSSNGAAATAAAAADIAIVFVGAMSGEGSDRANLSLPYGQDELVAAVVASQPNTIVFYHGPGAVLMPWASTVRAIVYGFFPGQEQGNAVASVLFGDHNPSAKLPITFPVNENDWFSGKPEVYPGVDLELDYDEKLLVGHRWYDANNIEPLFPFGHGLSYTTFEYSELVFTGSIATGLYVTFYVTNAGGVDGSEIPQLYISYPSYAGEPPIILRGFSKVFLPAGQTELITIKLGSADVSIYDETVSRFVEVSGTFTVLIGASSRDIRLKGSFEN